MAKNKVYTKEEKDNAMRALATSPKSVRKVAEEIGINYATLRKWGDSDWGKLKVAEYKVRGGQELLTRTAETVDRVIEAKVMDYEVQVGIVKELENLMNICIDRFNELIPHTNKISDVTDAFDSISNAYIKIIMGNQDKNNNSNKEDKSFILNLIEKQMVVKPIQLQELLKD